MKGMNRAMVLKTSGDLGEVTISNNVISEIAGAVATKCYGVVGMASRNKKDGIVNLLKPDNATKGTAHKQRRRRSYRRNTSYR